MKCPYCNINDNHVVDTRDASDGVAIWRRRECSECDGRFTTYERVEESPRKVRKKDNGREKFDRQKVRQGIEKACEKRPIHADEITRIVDEIERETFERNSPEISSEEIGEMVMSRLKELDEVAYIRFASVYREFKDLTEFLQELKSILPKDQYPS